MQYTPQPHKRGFVILFAVIIAAMIALIGAGIFSVAFKETVLSSTASESQVALFAADTGMECTLYHEYKEPLQPTLDCSGSTGRSVGGLQYEYRFILGDTPSCGFVSVDHAVTRTVDVANVPTQILGTLIVSRGCNVCIGEVPDASSQFLIERRLEAWFPNAAIVPPPGGGGGGGGGTGQGSGVSTN